ncbi:MULTISPECIES: hypothetical protein [unclassified Streptomyces]|uniref:GH12 family glycosyl hydrolase domain-containing protein n=1 Tax=unclassified Streptomyces TaxID=2593676 RepID=UPI00343D37D0
MKLSTRTAVHTLLPALTASAALMTLGGPAQAAEICGQYDRATVGAYTVQNNVWNPASGQQCVNPTGSGFELTKAEGQVPTDGAPKSYPSIYNGCHYTACSPGTKLPARISTISSAPTSVSYGYTAGGVYNASYDIWLDPEPKTDGVSAVEIMIWTNKVGPIQPIGSHTGATVTIAGTTWQVWEGDNGRNKVISYVAPAAVADLRFDVKEFVNHANSRGFGDSSWYLTSVQAGFEPWEGGAGLKVNSFSSEVNTG